MENRETFSEEIKKIFEDMKNTPEDQQQITHNGVLYPSGLCSSEIFEALSTFEAREDDIFMVAYPKCGTNWTVLMLQDMVYVVYNKNPSSLIPLIEFGGPGKYEKLKEESSPRILATHLHYDNIPKSFIDKKTKMLVVFRNPKDTALSYYHFYNNNPKLPTYTSWDTFFQDFMSGNVCWGSYFDQAIAWNKHIDDDHVMIITYEAMKEDLEAAVKKISEFVGMSLSGDQVQNIASRGAFKSMKEKSEITHGPMGKAIFRKGEVGDWKNVFTNTQNQEMDAKFEACLAGTKLGEMLKYNVYCK